MNPGKRLLLIGLSSALIFAACSTEVAPDVPRATPAPAKDSIAGTVAFTIDGKEHLYEHLPHGRTFYYSVSSAVSAKPSADSNEELTINFLSIDLKKTEYPATLPVPKTSAGLRDPMSAGAAVGFIYVDSLGTEWAGPGRIVVESFGSSGVLTGRFTNVSIPHTEKQLPNVILSDGHLEVQMKR